MAWTHVSHSKITSAADTMAISNKCQQTVTLKKSKFATLKKSKFVILKLPQSCILAFTVKMPFIICYPYPPTWVYPSCPVLNWVGNNYSLTYSLLALHTIKSFSLGYFSPSKIISISLVFAPEKCLPTLGQS